MMSKTELQEWLDILPPDAQIGIAEDALCLNVLGTDEYLEIGAMPAESGVNQEGTLDRATDRGMTYEHNREREMYVEIVERANDLAADLQRLESTPSEENLRNANASMGTLEETLRRIAEQLKELRSNKYSSNVCVTKSTHIAELPEKILADMVRSGCYARNTAFGNGPEDQSWLLVLAVPYGPDDGVECLAQALEGFRDMLDPADWFERQIQVLTVQEGKPSVVETSYEEIAADSNTADNHCPECNEYESECICGEGQS